MKKQVKKPAGKVRFISIRYRLMGLFSLTGLFLLLLVWWLTATFTEPLYQRYIYKQLSNQVNQMVSIIESCPDPISTRPFPFAPTPNLNRDFWSSVNEYFQSGKMNDLNCCVDIADSSLRWVNYYEGLHPCLIHESGQDVFSMFPGSGTKAGHWVSDTETMVALRRQLRQEGTLQTVLTTESGARQMAVGRMAQNGSYDNYTVIFSASLARIDEAVSVIGRMMPAICTGLLLICLWAAWGFSNWLSRPIHKLSAATRRMADGDYTVRVDTRSSDEIGILARDFNNMAGQVATAAQLQQELIANVSHDLRTPLTLIKGYAETVRDLTGDDKKSRTEQLNVIVDETDRLSGLVNSVMELSKVSSGVDSPHLVNFNICQLCEEVSQRYDAVCAKNGTQLQVQLPDSECPVTADPDMMERVLHNLLGNAMGHVGQDGLFILRVIPTGENTVRIEVEDHGEGIPSEDLPHIFERYYRSRKDSGRVGTGLGLSITKAILQSHGFRFGVSSTVGKGSCFWFEAKNS